MSMGLPCDTVVKNPPVSAREARDTGSTPGLGRYAGRGNSNPLQYSCLENYMDRGSWWVTVHEVAKSWIQSKGLSMRGIMEFETSHGLSPASWRTWKTYN